MFFSFTGACQCSRERGSCGGREGSQIPDPRSQISASITLQTPACSCLGACEQEPDLGKPLAWLRVWIRGTRGFQGLRGLENGLGWKDLKAAGPKGPQRSSSCSQEWDVQGLIWDVQGLIWGAEGSRGRGAELFLAWAAPGWIWGSLPLPHTQGCSTFRQSSFNTKSIYLHTPWYENHLLFQFEITV